MRICDNDSEKSSATKIRLAAVHCLHNIDSVEAEAYTFFTEVLNVCKACNRNNQLLERTEFGGYTVHITIQEYRGTHFVLA